MLDKIAKQNKGFKGFLFYLFLFLLILIVVVISIMPFISVPEVNKNKKKVYDELEETIDQ